MGEGLARSVGLSASYVPLSRRGDYAEIGELTWKGGPKMRSREGPEKVEAIIPPGLPPGACPHLRQKRRWFRSGQPDTPAQWVDGEHFCNNPDNRDHSALDTEGVEKCKQRGEKQCWMPLYPRGQRPHPAKDC